MSWNSGAMEPVDPKSAEIEKRQMRAVALRLRGRTYRDIYVALGYDSANEVQRDIEKYIESLGVEEG